jgi:hypothetical protein
MAKTLHHKGSGKLILRLNDKQHADLRRLLQEESTTDRDYYVDDTVLDHLEQNHADAQLVKALKHALEEKRSPYRDPATAEPTISEEQEGDGIDVEWRETEEGA